MKTKIILILISVQVTAIFFLTRNIYLKKSNILGSANVNTIDKEKITINPQSDLKFFYEPEPLTVDKPNEWIPYKATYTINSESLNERYEYDIDKPEDTFRIITLGDSWTYGLYVDTRDNWTEKLEDTLNNQYSCDKYNKFEVINLAYQGYDLQHAIERLKLRGLKYNPDLVLWFIKIDDIYQINELILPKEREIAESLTDEDFKRAYESGENYPSYFEAYRWYEKNYSNNLISEKQTEILGNFPKEYTNSLVFLTFEINSKGGIESDGEKLINEFIETRPNTLLRPIIPAILSDKNLHFETDNHPNKAGHMVIAESAFKDLKELGVLPCR